MSKLAYVECQTCGHSSRVEVDTVAGRLVETLVEGCEHERKRRRLCALCPASVAHLDRRTMYCPACRKEKNREWSRESAKRAYRKNRDKKRAARKKAYHQNPERWRAATREWRKKNPEKMKRLRQRENRWGSPGREAKLRYAREYYRANHDAILAKRRAKRAKARAEREAARVAQITPDQQKAA